MRGGMVPRMTLDNRPTKIVVKDIPQDSSETELRQHFEVNKGIYENDKNVFRILNVSLYIAIW
jgi:hypothetical protein